MAQERILVVEDEVRVAQALCRVFALPEGGGHHVEHCETGEAALARLKQDHFDLIICDLRMAGMNGLDLLEQAHQISPTTRSVLITAYGSPNIEERAKEIANAYVTKPFSMQGFVRTVRQILADAPRRVSPSSEAHPLADAPPPPPRRLVAFSEEGLRATRSKMEHLCADLGASGALLSDPAGQLILESGRHGDFELGTFLALLGNAMAASNQLIHSLQDEASFNLHYHEGKNYEMYTTRIGDQIFLTLIFDRQGGGQGRVGMIWIALRRARTEIRAALEHAVVAPTARSETKIADAPAHSNPAPPRPRAARDPQPSVDDDPLPVSPIAEAEVGVLSYEQARALGLINLDDLEAGK
ncbi:MAG: response regulator [Chloroflexi bacterium]|nr:response regulator [Chloroflexota bacterium]